MEHEPIHCLDPRAKRMIGKHILYAEHKEGLGTYGEVKDICVETGKFIIKPNHYDGLVKAQWVVEIHRQKMSQDTSVDLSVIPEGWFLSKLADERSCIRFFGNKHEHIKWVVELQHVDGGKLTCGSGDTPQKALLTAVNGIARTLKLCRG